MKVRTSVLRNLGLLALSSLAFAACEGKDPLVPVDPPAVSVEISPSNVVNLLVGQTMTYNAVVLGGAASMNRGVTFSSSTPAVATVNATTGLATAVGPGSTTIIATSTAAPTVRASAQLVVTGSGPGGPVTISVQPSAASIAINQTIQLVSIVQGTTNQNVTYVSASPTIASVSGTGGLVTGVSAGTAVITARSVADPTAVSTSVITVTPGAPVPPISITLTPTQATIGIGRTQTFVGLVSGGAPGGSQAVTYTSGTTAVATIDATTGVATGISAGTTVITARSVADPTKVVTGTLTVVSTIAPSVSIQSVTNAAGVLVGVGTTQAGALNVLMNVSAGSETNISRVEVRLNGVEGCRQEFNPPLAPTQGVAQINCVVNTAQLTAAGAPRFPNGTYNLTAVAIDASGADVATATYGSIVLNNANAVAGVITWDNSLNDTDNDTDAETDVGAGGAVWFGGSATVALTTAIFQGNQIATVRVAVDLDCSGGQNGGEPSRAVTITNGTGSVVFSEAATMAAATPGIDDLEDGTVCFAVYDARDASGAGVTLPAGAASGNVVSPATPLQPAVGPGQNQYRVDNVQATFAAQPGVTVQTGGGACPNTVGRAPTQLICDNGTYAGTGSSFTTATVPGVPPADAGVGGVTVRFVAVTATSLNAAPTQAQYAAAVATGTEISSANDLPESTVSNEAYTLVVEAKDVLGNVVYWDAGDFGVDLTLPTLTIQTAPPIASMANNSTNPAAELNVNITDTFSGPRSVRARITHHSVLEADTDAGTEVRCWSIAAAAFVAMPASGICPTSDQAVFDEPNTTTESAMITIPPPGGNVDGYFVIEVWSVDRAGNQSADMVTRTTLIDLDVPGGTIDQYTVNNASSTVSLNGTIRENVDLDYYDTRYRFPTAVTIPVQVPFSSTIDVDSYGLPLTGVLVVTGQNSVLIREIDEFGAIRSPDGLGFGATDVAGNFGYIVQSPLSFPAGNGTGLVYNDVTGTTGTWDLDVGPNSNAIVLDRSAGPTTATLSAIIGVTAATTTSPLSIVYFYFQHPGVNGISFDGDDYLVLLGSDTSADVFTGSPPTSDRTFTYTWTVGSTVGNPFPIDSFTYPVVAIGVDAQGDGIVSDKPTVRIQP